MISLRLIFLGAILLFLQACSYLPSKEFVPVSNETLTQWQVEGKIHVKDRNTNNRSYFNLRQIDDQYKIDLLNKDPIGPALATISGSEAEGIYNEQLTSTNKKANETAKALQNDLRIDDLGYWVRGLAATENGQVTFDKDDQVKQIKDEGWTIKYKSFMDVDKHLLPEKMELSKDKKKIDISLTRAETGYLVSPCEGFDQSKETEAPTPNPNLSSKAFIETLVPSDGSAPLPRWINKNEFCTQLVKLHGKVPDPRMGLYGPDSMMWKINGMLLPTSFGAGRALLLQTAHPWVTAGIDEHSIVRYDPIERARMTFTNISMMVFGSMPQALRAANNVHESHNQVTGKIPYDAGAFKKGSEYRANEVSAMIWVHSTLWETAATMFEKVKRQLTDEEKERYYEETKLFAMLFGIPEAALPRTWEEFMAYNRAMWDSPQLTVTDNTRALKDDLFTPDSLALAFPLWAQEVLTAGSLPPRIREGYDMNFGLWRKINYGVLLSGAMVTGWLLPKPWEYHSVYHEAMARVKGKRVGAFHRSVIKATLGTANLVN